MLDLGRDRAYGLRPMRKLIPLLLVLSVCEAQPVFAEDVTDVTGATAAVVTPPPSTSSRPTADDVLKMMASIPEERCLYNRHAKGCDHPGGYDKGPDARRIADAIAPAADGSIYGSPRFDAALMAIFTSYESGNKADAEGDCNEQHQCRAHGAFQLWYVSEEIAYDPLRAAPTWRSMAVSSTKTCAKNVDDEKLASLAGGCTFSKARQKVRQRTQLAREIVDAMAKAGGGPATR